MATPYYQDENVTLHLGDALEVATALPSGSVDCIITSPPYYGLRDYGALGQLGTEDSPTEYVANMVELFSELHRVLSDEGTLWLNIGDTYYSGKGNPGRASHDAKQPARRGWVRPVDRPGQAWGKRKGLLGMPWRVALALQDDMWTLRNDIIWHKPNAMPEPSARDRLTNTHEHLFMFSKSHRYWLNPFAIRETRASGDGFKHPGDMWSINTRAFKGAHFATFPPEIPRKCILAATRAGGVVLDPFSGSATTGMAALEIGRKYVGIDINPDYHDLALSTRLRVSPQTFPESA